MTDYFTSCLEDQVAVVQKFLVENDHHVIIRIFGPFDDVIFQHTDGTPVKCGGQPGEGRVMLIHSQK